MICGDLMVISWDIPSSKFTHNDIYIYIYIAIEKLPRRLLSFPMNSMVMINSYTELYANIYQRVSLYHEFDPDIPRSEETLTSHKLALCGWDHTNCHEKAS